MKFPWHNSSIVDVLKKDSQQKIQEKLEHVAKDLKHKKIDISELVAEMGPALTSTDIEIRLKGTRFLSEMFQILDPELLDNDQLIFVTTFYIDRMKDQHSIVPQVILGLLAITKMKNFPKKSSVQILQQLFQHIPCQAQVREDRSNIFQLIKYLSDNCATELEPMGADLIYGVISAIEGERDPRNLLFLFENMPTFIKTHNLRHLSEEMFEVFACYFPIDFHPTGIDPQAISRETLADKLANCLCASSEFADSCFNLAIEKLDSDLNVAKLDSLNLLITASKSFPIGSTIDQFDKVWDALKMEALPGTTKEVTDKALDVLCAFLMQMTSDESNLELTLNKIFTQCIGTLLNRDSQLYKPTVQLVLKCAIANKFASIYVAHKMIPVYLTDLSSGELKDEEKIDVFNDLNKILKILAAKSGLAEFQKDNYLLQIQKELITVLLSGTSQTTIAILDVLTTMAPIVIDEHRQVVYKRIKDNLPGAIESEVNCLLALAKCHPNEVLSIILRDYLEKPYTDQDAPKNLFRTLSLLIFQPFFRDHIIEFLLTNIFSIKEESIQLIVLENFNNLLTNYDDQSLELAKDLYSKHNFVGKLIKFMRQEDVNNSDVLYESSLILNFIMKILNAQQQTQIMELYLPDLHMNDNVKDLYVASGVLGFLDEKVELENHFESLVNDLVKLSISTTDEKLKNLANNLLCSLFNKAPDTERHRKFIRKVYDGLKVEIKNHNHQAVETLAWIAKGLMAKGHPDAAELVQDIADLLDHPSMSDVAALAFEILAVEYPNLHLPIVKQFFKQKLFVIAMKFLEHKLERFSENHLTATAHVFKITPHAVLKMNIEKVGPIMFKCIDVNADGANRQSKATYIVLKIINHFIQEKSQYMIDHLQFLVKRLSALTKYKGKMEIRLRALECLKSLTKWPLFLLTPFKQDVVLELESVLDDHKRLVRSLAVETRMAWYLLGDGSDDNTKK